MSEIDGSLGDSPSPPPLHSEGEPPRSREGQKVFHGVTIIDDNDLPDPGATNVATSHDVVLELLADGQSYAVIRQRGGVDAYVRRSRATDDVLAAVRTEAARLEFPRRVS